MKSSRRQFLQQCGILGASTLLAPAMAQEASASGRRFHLSISPDALQADPVLLELVRSAGVSDIWLTGYRGAPIRVGEGAFDDGSFSSVKGKTNELFSSLFHRRFARPEWAFSETTAFPADRLCARNMAAKLAISTISDVRNTMYMSGLTAFPRAHWQTLGPAMKRHAELHRRIAGHVPRGPLKHFWGEASRCVGNDDPYSLFLALGIPFEATGEPVADGFTFLSDADARKINGLRSPGTIFVARPQPGLPSSVHAMPHR
jgi:hypothetical protein